MSIINTQQQERPTFHELPQQQQQQFPGQTANHGGDDESHIPTYHRGGCTDDGGKIILSDN